MTGKRNLVMLFLILVTIIIVELILITQTMLSEVREKEAKQIENKSIEKIRICKVMAWPLLIGVKNIGNIEVTVNRICIMDKTDNYKIIKIWTGNVTISPGEIKIIRIDFHPIQYHYYLIKVYTRGGAKDTVIFPIHWEIPCPNDISQSND